jgi:sulfur carrier protein ThiS
MLRVRIVPCAKLARNSKVGRDGSEVALPDGGRVRDLLREVGLFDEEVRRVMVNGRRARLDTSLRANDLVQVEA